MILPLTLQIPKRKRTANMLPNEEPAANGDNDVSRHHEANEKNKDVLAILKRSIKTPIGKVEMPTPMKNAPNSRLCSTVLHSYRGPYCVCISIFVILQIF